MVRRLNATTRATTIVSTSLAWLLVGAWVSISSIGLADEKPAKENNTMSLRSLDRQSSDALRKGDHRLAVELADAIIRQHRDDLRAMQVAADIYLRTGDAKTSAKLYDRFVNEMPQGLPALWQRGIALYFVGEYEEAAKQFEEHRKVNPNDVENAAWHFLCVAKAESFDEAKKVILPAPGDSRLPMEEVHRMLSSGDAKSVQERIDATQAGTPDRSEAEFYGYFYLGLYADAEGDQQAALRYMKKCAEDAPHHYMGDIARVYAKQLAKPVEK